MHPTGGIRTPTRRWRLVLAAGACGWVLALNGCAPGTPDADSWRIDAQRALGDASSAVSAAQVALEQHREGRLFDSYLQTVLVDAETAASAAGDTLGGTQPPSSERERYDAVTGELDTAASLLSTARIAVVDGETSRYDALAARLSDAAARLHGLESDLEHPSR